MALRVKRCEEVLDRGDDPQEIIDALKEVDTVVVPLGSMEQHGPHLPVGTDTLIPITVAKRVAEKARVLVAPQSIMETRCRWLT